jgi:hypothetical protein
VVGWGRAVGRRLSLAAEWPDEASATGEVGHRAGRAGQALGGPGATARAAPASGSAEGPVLVGMAGQLATAGPTAGHGQRLGPAQPRIEVEGDAAAHRGPPPRMA